MPPMPAGITGGMRKIHVLGADPEILILAAESFDLIAAGDRTQEQGCFAVGGADCLSRLINYRLTAALEQKRLFEGGLCRINAVGNKVTLEFSYYFDNYRIVDLPCAVSVTFEGDKLLRAELYTIAAKNLGTRTESMSEKWYIGYMTKNGTVAQNTSLVYRSDFISESISAVWASSVKKNSTNDNDLYETRR